MIISSGMLTGAAYNAERHGSANLSGMTDTITADPSFTVSRTGAIVLRAMLARPKADHYCQGVADAIDRSPMTVRSVLRNLEAAGWLVSTMGPRKRYQARRNYRFTPAGAKLARAEIKQWNFTDA
jgi:DNA-binding MarR family transcriptional regulator